MTPKQCRGRCQSAACDKCRRARRISMAKFKRRDQHNAVQNLLDAEARGLVQTTGRPAWMEDPSLLPKRPPGRAE